jgi:hypothetical protein
VDNQKISHIVLIRGRKSFVATTAICLNAVAEAIWMSDAMVNTLLMPVPILMVAHSRLYPA